MENINDTAYSCLIELLNTVDVLIYLSTNTERNKKIVLNTVVIVLRRFYYDEVFAFETETKSHTAHAVFREAKLI